MQRHLVKHDSGCVVRMFLGTTNTGNSTLSRVDGAPLVGGPHPVTGGPYRTKGRPSTDCLRAGTLVFPLPLDSN